MSSLLEQAIIDATALKEAATKTAEKNLVEKYSSKIKEAVDKLLEQDLNVDNTAETPMDAASSLENTPSDLATSEMDKLEQPEMEQPKDPLSKVKSSFLKSKGDDEMITIDFSSLKAKPVDSGLQAGGMLPVTPVAPMGATPMPAAPSIAPAAAPSAPLAEGLRQYESDEADLMAEEEISEEVEIDLSETEENLDMEEGYPGYGDGSPEAVENLGGTLYEEEPQDEEVEIDLNEEEICEGDNCQEQYEEVQESLSVDMEPVSDGWRGMQPNEKREQMDVALAQQQDEEYQRKMTEYEEALEASENKIKKASVKNKALVKENEELKNTLMSLKEHLEGMNLSNAKLLYMNRILGNPSYNERQKSQIVESISRTDSVEAAKIAFETLQSAVGSMKSEVKAPKSLNEAVSRSTSPFLVRPRKTENNSATERMKLLAGIIKK